MDKKVCGAKTRRGSPCQRRPARGRNRCKLHGGATPRGIGSPHFKTGKYSKYLPDRLISDYHKISGDEELRSLRQELILIEAHIGELLQSLNTIEPRSKEERKVWDGIGRAIDLKRKVVPAEVNRLVGMGKMISADRLMILTAAIQRVILENVPERETRAAISEGMRQLFDREIPPEEYERAD